MPSLVTYNTYSHGCAELNPEHCPFALVANRAYEWLLASVAHVSIVSPFSSVIWLSSSGPHPPFPSIMKGVMAVAIDTMMNSMLCLPHDVSRTEPNRLGQFEWYIECVADSPL